VLVDCGPDLRAQALAHDIRRIDAIVFTHSHADHILGLDEIRRYNHLLRAPMACLGDAGTIADIRRMFGYIFDPGVDKAGGVPQLDTFTIVGPFCIGRTEFVPVPLAHGRRQILGFRIGGFAYLTDCNHVPESSMALLSDLDVLVIDALRERAHPTHYSLGEAVAVARGLAPRRTLFTHMCHDLPHAATCARLPDTMQLAYDGLVVEC
jgi:phosphoribosyl 1,2-cyclic phosphate phosphodiesterase